MSNLEDISGKLQKGGILFAFVIVFLIFISVSIPVILDSKSVQKSLSAFIVNQLNQRVNLDKDSFEGRLIKGISISKFKPVLFPLPAVELYNPKHL